MDKTFRYKIIEIDRGVRKTVLVEGVQVGRFAVRSTYAGEVNTWDRNGYPWIVNHLNSGTAVASAKSFEDAMEIADDVSRFSAKDARSRDPRRVREQMGDVVSQWLLDRLMGRTDCLSLRCWFEERGESFDDWLRNR